MEVKENPDRFKAACKSILDLIIEYVKSASKTGHERNEWFELDDDNACHIHLNNTVSDRHNFILTIKMRYMGSVNENDTLVYLRYRDGNLTYTKGPSWDRLELCERLLVEIFKDTMVEMITYNSKRSYELLVDTNKYINIAEIQATETNGQKALIDYCIDNEYPIYTSQLTLIIDHIEMGWVLRILPHFKGLVKLKCGLRFPCRIDMWNNSDRESNELPRDLYIARTCKKAEEKLVRMLNIDVQECIVFSETKEYQGKNIADRNKHKFYLTSIYLPFKNHPLMDARLIRYTAKFM